MKLDSARHLKADVTSLFSAGVIAARGGEGYYDLRSGGVRAFDLRAHRRSEVQRNHVLADENQGELGDTVLQPGTYDGGSARRDRVGRLRRFVALKIRRNNEVDCAVCELDEGIPYEPLTLRGGAELLGLATADELAETELVGKIGRTTGFTKGRLTAFELDGVTVRYDVGLLTFDNQVEIEGAGERAFSDGGDSGSMVFTDEGRGAGALVFAGSDQGGTNGKGLTYANPLGTVMERLKIELVMT